MRRVIVENRCGVPVRCIMTHTEGPSRYHVFFMGTSGLRTNMRGDFVLTPGEDIADVIVPSHGPRRRMIVAPIQPTEKSILVHDFFDSFWEATRIRDDVVIVIKSLRN